MKRKSFRTMCLLGRSCTHAPQAFNPVESVTDPTLALTGTQLAVASMLGQPIPQPSVNYSFNSATSPEMVTEIDSVKADPFEVYANQQKKQEHIKATYEQVKSTPEYQEYINSKNNKQNEK